MTLAGIVGPNHALLCGEVWGALSHLVRDGKTQVDLIDQGDSHSNQIRITRPSGTYLVTITPEDTTED